MLDINDFIRQSLRSAKVAIAVGDTLKEILPIAAIDV